MSSTTSAKGPGEYTHIQNTFFNTLTNEIDIYDRNRNIVNTYNMDGDYLGCFKVIQMPSYYASNGKYKYVYREADGFINSTSEYNPHLLIIKDSCVIPSLYRNFFIGSCFNSKHITRRNDNELLIMMIEPGYNIFSIKNSEVRHLCRFIIDNVVFKNIEPNDIKTIKEYQDFSRNNSTKIAISENIISSDKYLFCNFKKYKNENEYYNSYALYDINSGQMKFSYKYLGNELDSIAHTIVPLSISDTTFIFQRPTYDLHKEEIRILKTRYGISDQISQNPLLIVSKLK